MKLIGLLAPRRCKVGEHKVFIFGAGARTGPGGCLFGGSAFADAQIERLPVSEKALRIPLSMHRRLLH